MVIFQTVPLQRVKGVYGAINIRDRIDSRLELREKGAYNELVQDYHRQRKKL